MRVAGGLISDRRHRYKEVAGAGYAVSAACKLGFLAVGQAAGPATAVLVVDRMGKGIRTSPRDTLISLSAPAQRLAEAFGVHRAMDTAGALIGPVVAFFVLDARPDDYDAVFVLSFLVGVVGLGVLDLLRAEPPARPGRARRPRRADAAERAVASSPTPASSDWCVAAGLLAATTIGDAFVYLTFQRQSDFTTKYFPLLYVGTAFAYLVLAIPLGRFADRVGRTRVFLGGYLALAGTYLMLLVPSPGGLALIGVLGLLGVFYAATDGIVMAIASTVIPEDLRTTGMAVLTTVTALAGFGASVLFGAWWTWHGPVASVQLFLVRARRRDASAGGCSCGAGCRARSRAMAVAT